MGIDLELDGAGCTYLPKLDEDLKTVIAGADLPNDLMSRDQMEILQRLRLRAQCLRHRFDLRTPQFWYELPIPFPAPSYLYRKMLS